MAGPGCGRLPAATAHKAKNSICCFKSKSISLCMKISKRRDKTIMFNLCVHSEQSSDDVARVRVREGFNSEEAAEEVELQATASSKGWVR